MQKSSDETKECKEEYDATTDEESDTEVKAEKKVITCLVLNYQLF